MVGARKDPAASLAGAAKAAPAAVLAVHEMSPNAIPAQTEP